MRIITFVLLISSGLMASCATRTYFHNNSVAPSMQQQAFTIDSGECTATARSAMPPPPQSNSNIGYTNYSGQVTDGATGRTYDFNGTASQGNAGLNVTEELYAPQRIAQWNQDFKNIYSACLAKRGWVTVREK